MEKLSFTNFDLPPEKFWKNTLVAPFGKNSSDAHLYNTHDGGQAMDGELRHVQMSR